MTEGTSFLHTTPIFSMDAFGVARELTIAKNIHLLPRMVQFIYHTRISVLYLMSQFAPDKRHGLLGKCKDMIMGNPNYQNLDVKYQYKAMMRVITCVLAWVSVHEDLLSQPYPLFYIFPNIHIGLRRLVTYVKRQILHEYCNMSSQVQACFIIHEHVLAARLCLAIKINVLKDKAAEGLVPGIVAGKILHEILEPALQDMMKFRPTQQMIETLAKAITENVFDRMAPRHTRHGRIRVSEEDQELPGNDMNFEDPDDWEQQPLTSSPGSQDAATVTETALAATGLLPQMRDWFRTTTIEEGDEGEEDETGRGGKTTKSIFQRIFRFGSDSDIFQLEDQTPKQNVLNRMN